MTQTILSRGTTFQCSEPGCKSIGVVIRSGCLPTGWCLLTVPSNGQGSPYEVQAYCPNHDPVFDVPTEVLAEQDNG